MEKHTGKQNGTGNLGTEDQREQQSGTTIIPVLPVDLSEISFQKLRECTCNTSFDHIINNPPLGEWILAVDKATRVPGDHGNSESYPRQQSLNHECPKPGACTHCTTNRNIFSAAEAVAIYVKDQMSTQVQGDNHFQIQATGSYIGETQVLENSEFDFLLAFNSRLDKEIETKSIFTSYREWFQSLQQQVGAKQSTEKPQMTSVYEHGPAWCIEISWLKEGFENRISIDITLAERDLEIDMKTHCASLQDHPIYVHIYDGLHAKALYIQRNRSGRTTCVLQGKMVAALHGLSENILPVYRVMKVLVTLVLPKRIKYSENTYRRYTESSFINSHELIECYMEYVDKHGSAEQWKAEVLPQRMVDLLRKLTEDFDSNAYVRDSTPSMEERIVNDMICYFERGLPPNETTPIDGSGVFAFIKERHNGNLSSIQKLEELQHFLSDGKRDREVLVYFTHDLLFSNNDQLPAIGLLSQVQKYLYSTLKQETSAGRSNSGHKN